jgi:beta-ureidopropionase
VVIRQRRMASSNGKAAQAEEGKAAPEGSIGGYESLHRLLEANLSPELFQVPSIPPPGGGG